MTAIDYSLRHRVAALEAGMPVRKLPFAYNTPNLLTGAALYTPTIGDVLLDAWVQIVTIWNGTTPFIDVGRWNLDLDSPTGGWWGWFSDISGALGISAGEQDNVGDLDFGIPGQPFAGVSAISGLAAAGAYFNAQQVASPGFQTRKIPAPFVTADPVSVVVSTNGRPSSETTRPGADPHSTQGAAILYLMTARPV